MLCSAIYLLSIMYLQGNLQGHVIMPVRTPSHLIYSDNMSSFPLEEGYYFTKEGSHQIICCINEGIVKSCLDIIK